MLESRGDGPLKMTFEDQLKMLIFYHPEEHVSARHMLQVLEQDDFARENIAPQDGIKKSSFSEAINTRGLEQFKIVFEKLSQKASGILPDRHPELGDLVALDGSLIDATLSMYWADYRKGSKKAKIHLGFDLNHGIPSKIFFTNGKGAERPFVGPVTSAGQTAVADRGYQEHALLDDLQTNGKYFVIRIRANTTKTVIHENEIKPDSIVFFDAEVLLGTEENKKESESCGFKSKTSSAWAMRRQILKLPKNKNISGYMQVPNRILLNLTEHISTAYINFKSRSISQ